MTEYMGKVTLNIDTLILNSKLYGVNNISELPCDLNPRVMSQGTNGDVLCFGGMYSNHYPFSNWYNCKARWIMKITSLEVWSSVEGLIIYLNEQDKLTKK